MRFLEVAVFNYESAVPAKKGGANRLEVCENYAMGGFTPSFDFVRNVRILRGINVFVMIRQNADNFVYLGKDIDKMLKDIEVFKETGVDGFVFGGLDAKKNVNKDYCKEIIKAANPLPVTFHRAFDLCDDLNKATKDIIDCGFKRILTSGGKVNAYEGRFVIRELIERYGSEIIIMPGGGIRKNNIAEIEYATKATEFHTAGLRNILKGSNPVIEIEDIMEIKKIE